MQGRWRPSPTRDRKRRPLDPRIRKRGNPLLSSQAAGLCLGWGPPWKHHLPRATSSKLDPHPHPPPGSCCVSWTVITKGTPSRVSLPHPNAGGGAGEWVSPGVLGGRGISLTVDSGRDQSGEQGQQQQLRRGQHGVG